MRLKVEIEGVYYDGENKSPVVMLKEPGTSRRIPIYVGAFEAMAVLIALDGIEVPRPITHDLAANLLKAAGDRVVRVEISKIVDEVYYSTIQLELASGALVEVDSRPSDALALAVRFGAPVYVAAEVAEMAAKEGRYKAKDEEYWRRYLEGLDRENFGKYVM